MTEFTEVELPVVHHHWHWAMRRDRVGNRRRIEGEIAVRWLRRFVARTAATITRDPIVSLPQGCMDHWPTNQPCMALDAWAIAGGRRFGLPERLTTDSQIIALPVPDALRAAVHDADPSVE